MLKANRTLAISLLVSLVAGAALGAYLAAAWKERKIEQRVAAAVQVEKDRQQPLRDEADALRRALERERLLVEVAVIADEVDAKNFGLARKRLVKLGEDLASLADQVPVADGEQMPSILDRQEAILADLEALDPGAAEKLRQLFAELHEALGQE